MNIKDLEKLNFDDLTIEQRDEVNKIIKELKHRKANYPILDFELLPHQQEVIDALAKRDEDGSPYYKYVIMMGWNGAWKCWAKWTPLMKYSWEVVNVEDIITWDLMMWPDSKPREVLGTNMGREKMYTISPERDTPFTVNESHILSLIQRRRSKSWWERKDNWMSYAPEWELVNLTIGEYLSKSDRWKSEAKIWRPNVVHFKEAEAIKINPYFLWLWLWDGNSRNVWITTVDEECISWINKFAEENWMWVKINKDWITHRITNGRGQKNFLLTQLQEYDLILNKHIPHKILTSSYEERMQVLAWLIDSDWYKDSKGYKITQKRKQLSDDISFLARSLWFKVNEWERIARMKREDGSVYECLVYWNSIQWDCTKVPVKVERKKQNEVNDRNDCLLTWFSIEEKEVGEYYWFELDWDHLFLDWKFRVQHNTIIGGYATACKMMWTTGKKYWLPFLGKSNKNKVVTSTWTQIIENIEPYILWGSEDWDLLKIPPEEIKGKPSREKGVLKAFELKNWAKLNTGTYDQGMTRLQGGTPSFLWLDEIPERWKDFDELTKRTRDESGQFLITFTPTNYNKKIYDWIHSEATAEEEELYWKGRKFFIQVDALKNTKANHSHMVGKSEEDLEIIRFGKFVPPTGLVYKCFNREYNTSPPIDPKKLWSKVKFYGAVDFWVKHPTAFLFIAIDNDWHIFIFDMIYESNLLMKDLAIQIKNKCTSYGINLEYIVADSAGARERLELAEEWVHTRKANKKKKEGVMSNRRGWIMKINQLLNLGKLIVSDDCSKLIEEFETHHYKEAWEDGSVEKTDDDALDALRYFIFSYTEHSEIRAQKKMRRSRAKKAQRKRRY